MIHWILKDLPAGKQRLDTTLPLKMDKMHVIRRNDILKTSCPQELLGDEGD